MAWSILGFLEYRFRHILVFGIALLLSVGGLFFIASTCYAGEYFAMGQAWRGQLVWLGIACVVGLACALLDYNKLGLPLGIAYVVLMILLALTLSHGEELNHARRSLRILGLSFQTGIPARLVTVLLFAYWCARPPLQVNRVVRWLVGAMLVALPAYLIGKQPAWGNAGVLVTACLLVLLVHSARGRFMKYLVLTGLVGFVFLGPVLGWVRRQDFSEQQIKDAVPSWFLAHHIARFIPFFQPRGGRGNEQQIELCIRSGGLTGKGWQQGDLQNGGFLPHGVASSDYMLATVAEESGLLGCVAVLSLCAGLTILCLRVAEEVDDQWGRLICVGVASIFALQVVVSVGMVLRLFPIIGLTIPMLGHGGSILLVAYTGIGLVVSVQRRAMRQRQVVQSVEEDFGQAGMIGAAADGTVAIDLLPFGPLRVLLTLCKGSTAKVLVDKAKDTLGVQMAPIRHPITHARAACKPKQYKQDHTYELPGFREASMPGGGRTGQGDGTTATSPEEDQADIGWS